MGVGEGGGCVECVGVCGVGLCGMEVGKVEGFG